MRIGLFACAVAMLAPCCLASAQEDRDYVRVVATRSVFAYVYEAAGMFGVESRFKFPDIVVTNQQAGVRLLCAGEGLSRPDIGIFLSPITDSVLQQCARNNVNSLQGVRIGFDTLALAGAAEAEPMALTRRMLYLALAAELPDPDAAGFIPNPNTRWRQIDPGLPDQPIRIIIPTRFSSEYDLMVDTVMKPGCLEVDTVAQQRDIDPDKFLALCETIRSDEAVSAMTPQEDPVFEALQELEALPASPRAVAFVRPHRLDQGATTLTVDGFTPHEQAIARGDYPLARSIYIWFKLSHFAYTPGLRDFVAELLHPRAIGPDGYLRPLGLTPPPQEEREDVSQLVGNAGIENDNDTEDGAAASAASYLTRFRALEGRVWAKARNSADPRDSQNYIDLFPQGRFLQRATRRLATLERRDGDRDGIADHLDQCPGSAPGESMEVDGCPDPAKAALDARAAEIWQEIGEAGDPSILALYRSIFPAGPFDDAAAAAIDAAETADADGDGVADYLDRCPQSAPDQVVESDGCPDPATTAIQARAADGWAMIRETDEPAVLDAYLRIFPDGPHAAQAEAAKADLEAAPSGDDASSADSGHCLPESRSATRADCAALPVPRATRLGLGAP